MDKKYAIVVKTGEAELRALNASSKDILQKVLPIIEITRGRKEIVKKTLDTSEKKEHKYKYPFTNRLEQIKSIFDKQTVCLDLTSDINLSNDDIDLLYNPDNGYKNWIDFLKGLKDECVFHEIIPCIIMNAEDVDFYDNLISQINSIKSNFSSIMYRNILSDENCYQDFEEIGEALLGLNLYIAVDCGEVSRSTVNHFIPKVKTRISNLRTILPSNTTQFIVSSTSYPKNISDYGDVPSGTIPLVEQIIFQAVAEDNPINLIYSDYATVNPIRNDTVVMARGWIPKIEVPTKDEIYFYRKKRPKGTKEYSKTYKEIAILSKNDSRFPSELSNNWGVSQIISAAGTKVPSLTPNFWLSVRMNIHIEQQVNRIYSKK